MSLTVNFRHALMSGASVETAVMTHQPEEGQLFSKLHSL